MEAISLCNEAPAAGNRPDDVRGSLDDDAAGPRSNNPTGEEDDGSSLIEHSSISVLIQETQRHDAYASLKHCWI